MGDIKRRLDKLEEHARTDPDEERRREEAEHANYCGWGGEIGRWPLFEIDEAGGDVFCTHDGKPVTHARQILAECFYWQELEWGGRGLIYDEEPQAFYSPEGELAVSRDRVDLQHLMGPTRDYGWRGEG
jgi:hypothetical protein